MQSSSTDTPSRTLEKRAATGTRVRKVLLSLHRWAGLITGALVFLISVTGALYVFEKEIFGLLHRRQVRVEPRPLPILPANRLLAAGQAALGPGAPARWMEGAGPDRSVEVHSYVYDDSAKGIWFWSNVRVWKTAYVDPYTGTGLGVLERRFEFFNVVRQLHQNLLLRYGLGHWIVGVAVLVFLGMLITGLVLWWPRNRAALGQRLKVAWGSGKRRLRFDLHAVTGFYALVPLVIIAATGLVWSFGWWGNGFYLLLSGRTGDPWADDPAVESAAPASGAAGMPGAPGSGAIGSPGTRSALDIAFSEVMRRGRPGTAYHVVLPESANGVIGGGYMDTARSGWSTFAELKFDRYTGKILYEEDFARMDVRKKFRYSVYDIHVGRIYGWPTQVLAFVASLLCATLPVTGFLMWRGKRAAKAGAPIRP